MFNSQHNKLKSGIKNAIEVNLNLSSNLNDEGYFPHKLLFTDLQVSKFPKAFANVSSANIKL